MGDVSRLAVLTGLSDGSAGNRSAAVTAGAGDGAARVVYGDAYANQIAWTSPAMSGFTVGVGVVPVQDAPTGVGDNAANKDTYSVSAMYSAGPLSAAVNYVDNKGGTAPYKQTSFFASYDLGVAKLGLTHQRIDLATGVDPGNATALTANIPLGAGSIGVGYGRRAATASASTTFADDAKQHFVGYRHDLSKRTHVQLVHNKLNRTGSANDIKETHVVIGHSF
jgi:predicted porin